MVIFAFGFFIDYQIQLEKMKIYDGTKQQNTFNSARFN